MTSTSGTILAAFSQAELPHTIVHFIFLVGPFHEPCCKRGTYHFGFVLIANPVVYLLCCSACFCLACRVNDPQWWSNMVCCFVLSLAQDQSSVGMAMANDCCASCARGVCKPHLGYCFAFAGFSSASRPVNARMCSSAWLV